METTRWLTDDEQRVWRALIRMVDRLPAALDRQLQRDAGIPHAYYVILAMLSEAPGRSLRMNELAEAVSASQSRLSHAVTRLSQRGWVERTACETDGRGQVAHLTDAGYDVLVALAPGHVAEVARLVFDHLSPSDVHRLGVIAEAVNARIEEKETIDA